MNGGTDYLQSRVGNLYLWEQSVHKEELMSFIAKSEDDECGRCQCYIFSEKTEEDIRKPFGDISFWVSNRLPYLTFLRAVVWLLVAPILYVQSERNFSVLNIEVTPDRKRLHDDRVENIDFAKSFFDFVDRIEGRAGWCSVNH